MVQYQTNRGGSSPNPRLMSTKGTTTHTTTHTIIALTGSGPLQADSRPWLYLHCNLITSQ